MTYTQSVYDSSPNALTFNVEADNLNEETQSTSPYILKVQGTISTEYNPTELNAVLNIRLKIQNPCHDVSIEYTGGVTDIVYDIGDETPAIMSFQPYSDSVT